MGFGASPVLPRTQAQRGDTPAPAPKPVQRLGIGGEYPVPAPAPAAPRAAASSSSNNDDLRRQMLQNFSNSLPQLQPISSGIGGGSGGSGGGGVPTPMVNTAGTSPNAQWMIDRTKERWGDDQTKELMDRYSSEQRDIGSGLAKEAESDFARRGITGTGAEGLVRGKILSNTASNIAKGTRDIGLAQQARKDALLSPSSAIMNRPEDLALQQQGLGISQANMQQQGQIAQAQLAMQQQQALLNAYSSLFSMV